MPNEPDNKMDDLLKAYAQKRRADAGEPMAMHPATRRLLQAEVAKLRPKAEEKRASWFSALLARGPRLAFGVGVFAVLGAVVWMAVPSHDQSERQMFAKRVAPAENLELAKQQSKSALNESRDEDGLARPSKLKEEALGDKRVDLALSVAEKPDGSVARPLSPAPLAPSSQPSPLLSKEDKKNGGAPAPREADASQDALTALTGARMRQVSAPQPVTPQLATAPAAGDAPGYLDLGNFTNSAQTPDVLAVNVTQTGSFGGGAERKQVESAAVASVDSKTQNSLRTDRAAQANRYSEVAQPTTAAPRVQEQAVTLADAESRRRLQSNVPTQNQTGKDVAGTAALGQANQSLNYSAPSQAIQAPGTGLAINADNYGRSAGGAGSVAQNEKNVGTLRSNTSANEYFNFALMRASAPPVLASFGLEQRGEQIRVRDGDGSIYEGSVTAPSATGSAQTAQTVREPTNDSDAPTGVSRLKRSFNDAAGSRAVSFRVAGTNQTSKLLVTLEGTFVAGAAPVTVPAARTEPERQSGPNSSIKDASARTVQRIVGRATIGMTNEMRIDAVRTAK